LIVVALVMRTSNDRRTSPASHRATNEVRTGHQSQNGQGPWPHDPAVVAAAGRSDHRV